MATTLKEKLPPIGQLGPFIALLIAFNGFSVFTHGNWNTQKFVVAYIGIP